MNWNFKFQFIPEKESLWKFYDFLKKNNFRVKFYWRTLIIYKAFFSYLPEEL